MESVSGKFTSKQKYSTFVPEDANENVSELLQQIPPLPTSKGNSSSNQISSFLEEYFGRFWWLWIVVLLILKIKKV